MAATVMIVGLLAVWDGLALFIYSGGVLFLPSCGCATYGRNLLSAMQDEYQRCKTSPHHRMSRLTAEQHNDPHK